MNPAAQYVAVVALQRVAARQSGIAGCFDGQLHGAYRIAGHQVFELTRVLSRRQALGRCVQQAAVGEQQGVDVWPTVS